MAGRWPSSPANRHINAAKGEIQIWLCVSESGGREWVESVNGCFYFYMHLCSKKKLRLYASPGAG